MKRLLVAAGLVSAAIVARAEIWEFDLWTGQLSGAQEVPANETTATGGEVGLGIRYDDVSNRLEVNVVHGMFGFNPLEGNYSGSHLHLGEIGENGPVIVDLAPIHFSLSARFGFYQGTVLIPQEFESALLLGGVYMNIHSAKWPGGEIRGQLLVIPEPGTFALLSLGLGGLLLRRRTDS